MADWVVDSGDNRSMPFAIVDKTDAKVFVFDAQGQLLGAAPALLGEARGDDAVPGIGDRDRVITTSLRERRAHRLATVTPLDNRITYGCINIPKKFYENVVRPAFTRTYGIVYVLPEIRPVREIFGSYEVGEHAR